MQSNLFEPQFMLSNLFEPQYHAVTLCFCQEKIEHKNKDILQMKNQLEIQCAGIK